MQRHWWHRMLAPLLAVWFLVLTMEPTVLHVCPMHDSAHGASERAHHGASNDHHAAMASSEQAPANDATICLCLGECSGASPVAVITGNVAIVATLVSTNVRPGRPQHEWVAAWVDFVLPFGTAPPSHLS